MKRIVGLLIIFIMSINIGVMANEVYIADDGHESYSGSFHLMAMGDYGGNLTGATWYWPLHNYSSASSAYAKITSSYGYRGGSYNRYHKGVDIGESLGTAVYSIRSGTVSVVDNSPGGSEGRSIIINHNDGYWSVYMHLSSISVTQGQSVTPNTKIGAVGGSGNGSETGYPYHLHLGIHYGSSFSWDCNVNPCPSGYTRIGDSLQSSAGGYPIGSASISYSFNYTSETPAEPPQVSYISTDKDCYNINETVNFTFNTDGSPGCNVLWVYLPDGTSTYRTDLYNNYSLSFNIPGRYEAAVTAWNGVGNLTSSRISWYVGSPQKSIISTDKDCYNINETVNFTFNTDGSPGCNVLWVYLPDGTSTYRTDLYNNHSLSFNTPGRYEAAVTAWNGVGNLTSSRISWYVGSPQKSIISTDKDCYNINETVNFTFNTDGSPGCNVLWVYLPDGTSTYRTDLYNNYSLSFNTPGRYEAAVTAWNGVGNLTSSRISWYVGSPQKSIISTDKDCYNINETVNFTFNTDGSPGRNVLWVYLPDGTSTYRTDLYNNYSLSFNIPGRYEAAVTAWNGVGNLTSSRISWYVGPSCMKSNIVKTGSLYNITSTLYNFPTNSTILLGGYKGNRLVDVTSATYDGQDITSTLSGDIDTIKVMAWDDFFSMTPLCTPEIIPSSEFIVQ